MSGGTRGSVARSIRTLFGAGSVAGMTDRELLDQFLEHRGDAAEAAFAAIVKLHGPMVWGVCRGALADLHDAEDAFQAVFLILVRKARTVRRRDTLGPWLYGVARRVAVRAGVTRTRRREQRGAEMEATATPDPVRREEVEALHQELDRLPEKYRAVVVLCHLEGKTHAEAARLLDCPVGTVNVRASRAREILRGRLTRRGLAVPAALAAALAPETASAAVPAALAASTVKVAMGVAAGKSLAAAEISAAVFQLSQGVLRTMTLTKLTIAASCILTAGALSTGLGWVAMGDGPDRVDPQVAEAPREASDPGGNRSRPEPAAKQNGEADDEVKVPGATQAEFGTIKGRLVWGRAAIPEEKVEAAMGRAAKDPDVCAKNVPILSKELVVDPETRGIAHGFAYLIRPRGANPEALADLLKKAPTVEIDQKNCEFLPHCAAINKGQTLVLKSSDPVMHNVRYSGFNNFTFNQTISPNASFSRNLAAERLPIPIVCDIHPWMKAYVMVFDHPFFAVTRADGSFEIEGVPAGKQKFVLWQEKAGFVTPNRAAGIEVDVKPGAATNLGDIATGK